MGKIKVRKKLRKNKKDKLSIYSLIALSILFVFFMFLSLVGRNNDVFKVESREKSFVQAREKDTEHFETMGWIRVQGTNIDYPVRRILDENYGRPINGESYAWSTNDGTKLDKKIDVSGHNILNLSSNPVMKDEMFIYFEELMNFVYYDFAKENQFIQLNVNGEDYIYKIFSVNFLKVFDVNRFSRSGNEDEDVAEFLDMLDKGNFYDYDTDVNDDDKIITLHTCTRFYGRDLTLNFSVTGRLLRDGEKIELSDVDKTDKYDEIVQILEGGEEDE